MMKNLIKWWEKTLINKLMITSFDILIYFFYNKEKRKSINRLNGLP